MKNLLYTLLLHLSCYILCTVSLQAKSRDTIRYYDSKSASSFYSDPKITAQAARFDLLAPAYIKQIDIWFTGPSSEGTASLAIYGNEGGLPAPLYRKRAAGPFLIEKKQSGVQKISFPISEDIFINSPQFFVTIDMMTEGMYLLSDRRVKNPVCSTEDGEWLYQLLQYENGAWVNGKYGYAIDVTVEYPQMIPPSYLANVTEECGIVREDLQKTGISWGDVDNDGWPDLMSGGVLFKNNNGSKFQEIIDLASFGDTIRAHAFIDMNNDGYLDIAMFTSNAQTPLIILKNDNNGGFTLQKTMAIPIASPSTFAIADVNQDGWLDLFVGGDSGEASVNQIILMNDNMFGFTLQDIAGLEKATPVIGAMWIDMNSDEHPDLLIDKSDKSGKRIFINNAQKGFSEQIGSDGHWRAQRYGASDIGDVDGNGSMEAVTPMSLIPSLTGEIDEPQFRFTSVTGESPIPVDDYIAGKDQLYWVGAGTLADPDNDGKLDALLTTSCNCQYAMLYSRDELGAQVNKSFEYGLFRVPAGNDAVWCDFDNDGKQDLATYIDGRFTLLKNTGNFPGSFIEVDFNGTTQPNSVTGTYAIAYTNKGVYKSQSIVLGRGNLMQGNACLHIGLGESGTIDSLVVYNQDKTASPFVYTNPAINTVFNVYGKQSGIMNDEHSIAVQVSPNPSTTSFNFQLTLQKQSLCKIDVYAADGKYVASVVNKNFVAGTHTVVWHPESIDNERLSPGTYIYEASFNDTKVTGRMVLVR